MNEIHEMAFPLFVRKGDQPSGKFIGFLKGGKLGKIIRGETELLLGNLFKKKENIDKLMVGLETLMKTSGVSSEYLAVVKIDKLHDFDLETIKNKLNRNIKYDVIYLLMTSPRRIYALIALPQTKQLYVISYGRDEEQKDGLVSQFLMKLQDITGIIVEKIDYTVKSSVRKSTVWLHLFAIIYILSQNHLKTQKQLKMIIARHINPTPVFDYNKIVFFRDIVDACKTDATDIAILKSTGTATSPEQEFIRFVYKWASRDDLSIKLYDTFESKNQASNNFLKLLKTSKKNYLENQELVNKMISQETPTIDLFSAIYSHLDTGERMSHVQHRGLRYFQLYQKLAGDNVGGDLHDLVNFVTNGKKPAATKRLSDAALEKWLVSNYKVEDGSQCVVRISRQSITPNCAKTLRCLTGTVKGGKLRDYQIDVLNKLWNKRGVLIAHGPGTGKTRTALLAIKCLSQKYIFANIFIVTPKAVIGQFRKDSQRCLTHPVESRITYLTHDDLLLGKGIDGPNGLVGSILIIDEIHNFRNIMGKRTKKLIELCNSACHVILMTGTPFINNVGDLSIYNELLLKPDKGDSRGYKGDSRGSLEVEKEKKKLGLEWLQIDGMVSVYSGKENTDYFPKIVHYDRIIHVTDANHIARYSEICNECDNVALVKTRQYLDYSTPYKLNAILMILAERQAEIRKNSQVKLGGILIYMPFLKGIKYFQEELLGNNYSVDNIQGASTKTDIENTISSFNDGKLDVLLVSDAGSEGIDLKNTWGIIFASGTFHNSARVQIIGRGVRYLSHQFLPVDLQRVNVYDLILTMGDFDGKKVITSDQRMFDITHRKEKECDSVMSLLAKM